MLFNSIDFLVFFPVVCILFFALPPRRRWVLLLLASYWFYMSWKPEYAVLIALSTLVDYWCACRMAAIEQQQARRPLLYLSISVNLGMLFLFKYLGFFTGSVAGMMEMAGFSWAPPRLDILLPVGISFYTFQTMSYTVDVYWGRVKPEHHLGIFAVFVSFFPQLVAGPIERAGNLLPQFRATQHFDAERIASGLRLMAWGMFKKVVIADRLAVGVDHVYNDAMSFPGPVLALATLLFAFQIYCDFSGYSDIALGGARVLGFTLMTNFRSPYHSGSISEFWQRWHISLSTWFRDYVYIPLGGNRTVRWRWYHNLLLTFLISGLWHGAAWTFVVWGALHGAYLVLAIVTGPMRDRAATATGLARVPQLMRGINVAWTFLLVCLGWVFFRAADMSTGMHIATTAFTGHGGWLEPGGAKAFFAALGMGRTELLIAACAVFAMEAVHVVQARYGMQRFLYMMPTALRWAGYYALIAAIIYYGAYYRTSEFIYFQF